MSFCGGREGETAAANNQGNVQLILSQMWMFFFEQVGIEISKFEIPKQWISIIQSITVSLGTVQLRLCQERKNSKETAATTTTKVGLS